MASPSPPPQTPNPDGAGLTARPRIEVHPGHRFAVVGMSGSGKTVYTKRLVRELVKLPEFAGHPVYVLDTKGEDFETWPGIRRQADPPSPATLERGIQVWQPPTLRVPADAAESWLAGIVDRKAPAVLLIDELTALKRGNRDYPVGLEVALKVGRGMGLTPIVLTQAASKIPPEVIAQSTHAVRFHLQWRYDRWLVDGLMGRLGQTPGAPPPPEPAREYGFFYARMQRVPAVSFEYADFREFFTR